MSEEPFIDEINAEAHALAVARLHTDVLVQGVDAAAAEFVEAAIGAGAEPGEGWAVALAKLRARLVDALTSACAPRDPTRITRTPTSTTIRLSKPIRIATEMCDEIRLEHPTGKQMTALDGKRDFSYKCALISACSRPQLPIETHVFAMAAHDIVLAYEEACLLVGKPWASSPG